MTKISDTKEFETFITFLQDKVDTHYEKMGFVHQKTTFEYTVGRKYIRVITNSGSQRSVYCFVDNTTGDIYKASGWKGVAKRVRGHITNNTNCCHEYSAS